MKALTKASLIWSSLLSLNLYATQYLPQTWLVKELPENNNSVGMIIYSPNQNFECKVEVFGNIYSGMTAKQISRMLKHGLYRELQETFNVENPSIEASKVELYQDRDWPLLEVTASIKDNDSLTWRYIALLNEAGITSKTDCIVKNLNESILTSDWEEIQKLVHDVRFYEATASNN